MVRPTEATTRYARQRVLVISAEYPPHVEGGLGVVYQELLEPLCDHCDVTLICALPRGEKAADAASGRVRVIRVPIPDRFPLNHLVFNLQAWRLSRRINADVLHLCAPFGVFNLLFDRRPKTTWLHSLYRRQRGSLLYQVLIFPAAAVLDRIFIRRSNLIITASDFMAAEVAELVPAAAGRVVRINPGVAAAWFERGLSRTEARHALALPADALVIVNVGRTVPRKGKLELVLAFAQVHAEFPHAQLVLVGDGFAEGGSYSEAIQEAVDTAGLADAVTMVGWQPQQGVHSYYEAADLYVHAAGFEPFGMVLLEAAAAGLPVIAAQAGGPEEVLGSAGMITATNSPHELGAAICAVLGDEEKRRDLATGCRERATAFSWAATAARVADILRVAARPAGA